MDADHLQSQKVITASNQPGAPTFFHSLASSHLISGLGLSQRFSLTLIVNDHFSKRCDPFLAIRIRVNQCCFCMQVETHLSQSNITLFLKSFGLFSQLTYFNSKCSSSTLSKTFLQYLKLAIYTKALFDPRKYIPIPNTLLLLSDLSDTFIFFNIEIN